MFSSAMPARGAGLMGGGMTVRFTANDRASPFKASNMPNWTPLLTLRRSTVPLKLQRIQMLRLKNTPASTVVQKAEPEKARRVPEMGTATVNGRKYTFSLFGPFFCSYTCAKNSRNIPVKTSLFPAFEWTMCRCSLSFCTEICPVLDKKLRPLTAKIFLFF